MNLAATGKLILRGVLGLAIAGAAFYTGWIALHEKPVNMQLVKIAAGGILLGGAIIDGDPIIAAVKRLLSVLPTIRIGGAGNGSPDP